MDKYPFMIDIQLHTEDDEDEEVNDDGYQGNEDEDDPDEDEDEDSEDKDPDKDVDPEADPDDEQDDDPEDEDPDPEKQKDKKKANKKPDPVTAALIEVKRKLKEVERENKALRDKKTEEDQAKADEDRVKQLIADGYGEVQAKQIVASDAKTVKLEREIQKLKFDKLEKKYPGIADHADAILDIEKKSNGALTIEEIYNAKFRKSSEYDIKTNTEAATLHKLKAGKEKSGVKPEGGSSGKPVVLSPSDERAYKHLTRQKDFQSLTRKQFMKMNRGGGLED